MAEPRSTGLNILFLVIIVLFGILEGISFHRTGITNPAAIFNQMIFKNWIVMKLFFGAIGSSMVIHALLASFTPQTFDASRVWKKKHVGFLRTIVGCALLGVGMSTCGSGPTMLPPQIGANVENAWATLIGFFLGGVSFALWERFMPSLWCELPVDENTHLTLDSYLGINYEVLSGAAGLVILGVAVALELIFPYIDDAKDLNLGYDAAWPPVTAGIIVGFNQLPLRLIAGHGQGGSTAPMVVLGTITAGRLAPKQRAKSFAQAWQFTFVYVGSTLGAVFSAFALPQHDQLNRSDGYAIWRCLAGGFLMLFGARIANGCTCGHGISGISELGFESVVGTMAIFGGAIPMGFLIQYS